MPTITPVVYMADADQQCWLKFSDPLEIVQAAQIDAVLPALQHIEKRVESEQLYAAGFISYEASPAFHPAMQTHPPESFPLLWFGLYRHAFPMPAPAPAGPVSVLPGNWIPSLDFEDYNRAIEQVKSWIAVGHTYQVNFTLRMHAPFAGDSWDLFTHMYQRQPVDYAAYLDLGRYVICSASPELFFRRNGSKLTCKPMKGTTARGLNLADDRQQADWLFHSQKNRAENVMIVDMLRNDLGKVAAVGSVKTERLFDVERYPTVWQMTSTVTAESQANLVDIFCALFPCASITGAPKIRTMQIICSLEDTRRDVYTGCIGFISPQRRAQFNVAIRTILLDRQTETAVYGVGGGIVWDSTSADEYFECQVKSRMLTQSYIPFDLLESLLWEPETGYYLVDEHLDRLAASAEYFGFPFTRDWIQAKLDAASAGLTLEAHKVRLLLTRQGEAICQAAPLKALPVSEQAQLVLAEQPVQSGDVFLYHKTTRREVYEAARKSCPPGCEPLLWNERGELTETDSANLVVRLDGQLYTPPVTSGLLAGTLRARLVADGQLQERILFKEDLPRCTELYLINSVRQWRPAVLRRTHHEV